ncbi:BSD DOMAIN-CONTAINING PROTEIN [Salix koriyanagi]|uniref:BSD DOMAIN-CONTAINING PROTEIN n=1 Tax=Salix koriyanagi TaxID=2511006 RepID=A0A9Q0ZFP5_9ROSI|nr:BSD DOMAIN-CONTAINING PROTEIN [Salix koriyanagi]
MAWLARSIANSLNLDDDDDDDEEEDFYNTESDQQQRQSTTPRGLKEDLTDLKQTLSSQFWGVASFLSPQPSENDPHPDEDDAALIAGIRSDFAEIGGKFKSGISKLSTNKTVSEFTKIASDLLQLGSDSNEDEIETIDTTALGVTEEVVGFARDVAMHPETWLDFPIPRVQYFEEFDISDAQQEHALAVERLAPRLAALRIELCPRYMSEGCFWKIYFVLLHPRLPKHDAQLLSTPQIMEARAMLSHELQNKDKAKCTPRLVWVTIMTSGTGAVTPTLAPKTPDHEAVPSNVSAESETEKHPVESTQMQIIDKYIIEEEKVNQTKHQHSPSSSSRILDEKFEDDGDDWLKDDSSEMIGASVASMSLGNDEDVSFSDLEEDDEDEATS